MCITTICTTSILKTISLPLFIPLLPIYPVSTLDIDYLFFCLLFIYYYLYFILKCVLCHSFGSCHGKTKWWFIPAFPGPLQIVARLCFCFFFSSPFFWYHFFQLSTSVRVWQVCHCGPLSLFVYHSLCHCHNTKLLTIDRECLFNYDSYSSSLSLSV